MQHRAKKRLGQNFLVDTDIIDKIIRSIDPRPDDHVIEIGPGLGALTQCLLKSLDRLDVIELDRDVIPELNKLGSRPHLHVHNMDVLEFDFDEFRNTNFSDSRLRIVGNLPYNISTAVLFHLMDHKDSIQDMHFMLQKEVVERVGASIGSHNYGRLSVMMQLYFKISPLFTVPPQCFRPVPKVESAVVRLVPHNELAVDRGRHSAFSSLVKQAFSQRRKTLKNTLRGLCDSECFRAAGIDPGCRPQELGVYDFIRLLDQLNPDSIN